MSLSLPDCGTISHNVYWAADYASISATIDTDTSWPINYSGNDPYWEWAPSD